jgi:hypothetical protein
VHDDDDRRPIELAARELILNQRTAVVVQNANGRIVDHNPAALDALAMTADQMLGRSSLDDGWMAVGADGRPMAGHEHPAMRALASGRPVLDVVMCVRGGDGTSRWLIVDSFPIPGDPSGPPDRPAVVTSFVDVTAAFETRALLERSLERLQRHALPDEAIEIDGMDVHVRYQNVTAPLDVGGDFIDVIKVHDDRHKFFIGDAAGHEIETVATTLVAHHTLRAASLHLKRPDRVLTWLHNTLRATPDTVFCSAIHGSVQRTDRGFEVRFANAGHPPPILVRGRGARQLDRHGMVLGTANDFRPPPIVTQTLERGDQLVLYTDGLIESLEPRWTPDDLCDALASHAALGSDANRTVIDVIDELIARSSDDEHRRDDIAVLVFDVGQ